MHLVSWDMVRRPTAEGGLQIRDPSLVNLALGGKILWKMVSEPNHQTNNTLMLKYSRNTIYRGLQFDPSVNGTQIWKLCSKSRKFFNQHLYRVPGNDKRINIWNDRIMGNDPLGENEAIMDIREWLLQAGKTRLYDISSWDSKGEWAGWDINGIPDWLIPQKNQLIDLLEGSSPEHRHIRDSWAWGMTGTYTTAAGYKALQSPRNSSHAPTFWKSFWENLSLPKVNFFFWTLVHNTLLTGDNLEKRNIAGPHRCELCRCHSETAQHLFLGCKFSKEAWDFALFGLQIPAFPQNTVADLFASWNNIYPHSIPSKSFWKKIWTAIPKFVCWQIWLARNDQIFNKNRITPLQSAAKAKALLLEAAQR